MDLLPLVSGPVQVTVDYNGGKLSSPLNDFEINIPPGAILKNDNVTIRAATCAIGMFTTPNDAYRISDFICVSTTGQLLSPVAIKVAHCLRMPEYENTAAIVMLHADSSCRKDSGEFIFSILDCSADISSTEPFISVHIKHFCVFCAAYFPRKYRGVQRNQSSDQCTEKQTPKPCRRTSKRFDSPYTRPSLPCLDYVLIFYEHKEKKSPFQLLVFACLNCPGSIEVRLMFSVYNL